MPRSIDSNPELSIPRMTFEFTPDGTGNCSEFSLAIPDSDIEVAIPLSRPLDYMPKPQADNMREILDTFVTENEGGKMDIKSSHGTTTVSFGFTTLPPKATVPAGIIGFNERTRLQNEPREPQLIGRKDIFSSLAKVTNLQYQFGIPLVNSDDTLPVPPARLSFRDGKYLHDPRVIVTHEFEDYRSSLTPDVRAHLTEHVFNYLVFLDKPRHNDPFYVTGDVTIGAHRKIYSNGDSSYGRRSELLTEIEIADKGTDVDFRLQRGDAYICDGHNLDQIPDPRLITMVSVGLISHHCREQR